MAEIGTGTVTIRGIVGSGGIVRIASADVELELEQLRRELEAAKEVIKNQRLDADWWIEALKEASDDADKAEDIANAAIELAYAEWQKTVPAKLMIERLSDLAQRFGEYAWGSGGVDLTHPAGTSATVTNGPAIRIPIAFRTWE